jgi:hypothetical protein
LIRGEENALRGIWKRGPGDLEGELRAARAEPRPEFLAALSGRIRDELRPRHAGAFRLAFAGGLTVVMLVALAAVGGVSYAADAAAGAAHSLEKVVTPSSAHEAIVVKGLTAGGDQYQPGFGWGDANHNHDGPPGISRRGGPLAPPLRAVPNRQDTRFMRVSTSINLDEQANLSISVETGGGQQLLLSQRRSTVGDGVEGASTKHIQYLVLVPRDAIPVALSIPKNLLRPGVTYYIVIRAVDPDGNARMIRIPFRV